MITFEPAPAGTVVDDHFPAERYHAVESLSSGGVRRIVRSPAHFLAERTKAKAPSAAMQFGSAVHFGVLEPERFAAEVVEAPKFDRRTTAGKAAAAEWEAANAGKLSFDPETFAAVRESIAAVQAHPSASRLLSEGRPEVSAFWRDGRTGAPLKARFDYLRADGGVVDVKTTRDASAPEFARSAATFGYHVQAAHYWLAHEAAIGSSPAFFAFVCVETEAPFGVACYVLDEADIRAGMRTVNRAIELYAQCLRTGKWPSYPATVERLLLPKWARTFVD